MSHSHLEYVRQQLEATQAKYTRLLRIPEEDTFPVGTVLRIVRGENQTSRIAHKGTYDVWFMDGQSGINWYELTRTLLGDAVRLEVAKEWEDVMLPEPEEQPDVVVRRDSDDPSTYEIYHHPTGASWRYVEETDRWIRICCQ